MYERRRKTTASSPPVQLVEELVVMLPVFQVMMIMIMMMMMMMIMTMLQLLTTPELAVAARVCRAWHKVSLDPSLWTCVDLTRQVIVMIMMMMIMMMMMMMMIVMQRITAHLLSTTVQKQPVGLSLDWSSLGKQQLNWLVFIIIYLSTLHL